MGEQARRIGDLRGPAYRCPICEADARWTILREGDAAASWACADHLDHVLELMQRDFEVTRLIVRLAAKAREWAEMGAILTDDPTPARRDESSGP